MIILLSPAKIMDMKQIKSVSISSEPIFESKSRTISRYITEMSIATLSASLKASDKIARNSMKLAYDFISDCETKPAIDAFNGVAFKQLNAIDFSVKEKKYAQDHLLIGSAMYGILRPYDLIKEYRLDFDSYIIQLANKVKLHNFWKGYITDYIAKRLNNDDNTLIILSSKETSDAINLKSLSKNNRIINVRFLMNNNSTLKTVPSVIVKKARGALARYMVKNNCNLETFSDMNMRYCDSLSDEFDKVFIYETK